MSAGAQWPRLPQLRAALRRLCGGACRVAMDQLPSLADPQLREAFASWSVIEEPEAPANAHRSRAAPGGRGQALVSGRAAVREECQ
jgi:hypothetical protein